MVPSATSSKPGQATNLNVRIFVFNDYDYKSYKVYTVPVSRRMLVYNIYDVDCIIWMFYTVDHVVSHTTQQMLSGLPTNFTSNHYLSSLQLKFSMLMTKS